MRLLLVLLELLARVVELALKLAAEGLLVGLVVGGPVAAHVVLLTEMATGAEKCIVGAKVVPPPKAVAKEVLQVQEIIVLIERGKRRDERRREVTESEDVHCYVFSCMCNVHSCVCVYVSLCIPNYTTLHYTTLHYPNHTFFYTVGEPARGKNNK